MNNLIKITISLIIGLIIGGIYTQVRVHNLISDTLSPANECLNIATLYDHTVEPTKVSNYWTVKWWNDCSEKAGTALQSLRERQKRVFILGDKEFFIYK